MNANVIDKEIKAYEKSPFDELTIQDALTIMAIEAVRLDPKNCRGDIRRIEIILQNQVLFKEKVQDTRDRIQKFVNQLRAADPLRALKSAANVLLDAGMEETAFVIVLEVAVCDGALSLGKISFLKNFSGLLAISDSAADRMIKTYLSRQWGRKTTPPRA
jgi:hypothetical protein